MLKICQKCGHPNPSATGTALDTCPQCGVPYNPAAAASANAAPVFSAAAPAPAAPSAPLKRADEKFCSECGALINVKAEICPKCGVRQMPVPFANPLGKTSSGGRNKVVAGFLGIFLGGLGVHKFYLGKGLQGVLYLVFCWTFIPAIIGFIEGLNYFLMSEKTFFERYGS